MVTCGGCGKEMRAGNLARHQRGACRVWGPGGGQTPDRLTGVDGPNGWMEHLLVKGSMIVAAVVETEQ